MIFAKEPFLLHLLSGSDTITALDAAKGLLDSGAHDANEMEPTDNLSPLHVAAAWDNLAMCQLLIHYGADVNAQDIDKRRPVDVACGECKRFLKRLRKKRQRERNKVRRLIGYLFRGICTHPDAVNQSIMYIPEESKAQKRKSCPADIQTNLQQQISQIKITNREEPPQPSTPPKQPNLPMPTNFTTPPPRIVITNHPSSTPLEEVFHLNPQPTPVPIVPCTPILAPIVPCPSTTVRVIPSAPRRSSSVTREEEFLTSDHTVEGEIQLTFGPVISENEAEQRKQTENEEELRKQFAQLKLDELKEKLRRKCPVGPLDGKNRKIYESKLAKLEAEQSQREKCPDTINQYSPTLRKWIFNEENGKMDENKQIGKKQELQIRNEFTPSAAKKEVSFFCYLLIDPTRLPTTNDDQVTFRRFLSSIFYVGKGNRSRPLQHLIQAHKCRNIAKIKRTERTEKLKRILNLWDSGQGVISLHIFYNVHSAEAFIREGAMIDAIDIANLTNLQRGSFSGISTGWSKQQITEFGTLLLHKAHAIFQNERCRPIFEADVEDLNPRYY